LTGTTHQPHQIPDLTMATKRPYEQSLAYEEMFNISPKYQRIGYSPSVLPDVEELLMSNNLTQSSDNPLLSSSQIMANAPEETSPPEYPTIDMSVFDYTELSEDSDDESDSLQYPDVVDADPSMLEPVESTEQEITVYRKMEVEQELDLCDFLYICPIIDNLARKIAC